MLHFRARLVCILLMSSVAPQPSGSLAFGALGGGLGAPVSKACGFDLHPRGWLPSPQPWRGAIALHWCFFFFFLSFYLHFSFFLSFLKKDFLCFNPCLSKRLFFLIWKPISFGLHRSCLWCDGSCWKSPKEYLCSQLEVEAELHTGARGGGWLG